LSEDYVRTGTSRFGTPIYKFASGKTIATADPDHYIGVRKEQGSSSVEQGARERIRSLTTGQSKPVSQSEKDFLEKYKEDKGATSLERQAFERDFISSRSYSNVNFNTEHLDPASRNYVNTINEEMKGATLTGQALINKEKEVKARLNTLSGQRAEITSQFSSLYNNPSKQKSIITGAGFTVSSSVETGQSKSKSFNLPNNNSSPVSTFSTADRLISDIKNKKSIVDNAKGTQISKTNNSAVIGNITNPVSSNVNYNFDTIENPSNKFNRPNFNFSSRYTNFYRRRISEGKELIVDSKQTVIVNPTTTTNKFGVKPNSFSDSQLTKTVITNPKQYVQGLWKVATGNVGSVGAGTYSTFAMIPLLAKNIIDDPMNAPVNIASDIVTSPYYIAKDIVTGSLFGRVGGTAELIGQFGAFQIAGSVFKTGPNIIKAKYKTYKSNKNFKDFQLANTDSTFTYDIKAGKVPSKQSFDPVNNALVEKGVSPELAFTGDKQIQLRAGSTYDPIIKYYENSYKPYATDPFIKAKLEPTQTSLTGVKVINANPPQSSFLVVKGENKLNPTNFGVKVLEGGKVTREFNIAPDFTAGNILTETIKTKSNTNFNNLIFADPTGGALITINKAVPYVKTKFQSFGEASKLTSPILESAVKTKIKPSFIPVILSPNILTFTKTKSAEAVLKEGLVYGGELKVKTAEAVLKEGLVYGLKVDYKTALLEDTLVYGGKTKTLTKTRTKEKLFLIEEQVQIQEVREKEKLLTIQKEKSIVKTDTIFNNDINAIRTRTPFMTPIILVNTRNRPNIKPQSIVRGFDVLVRRKGKFEKITSSPLSKSQALQFGAFKVGNTAAATFKLRASSSNQLGSFTGRGFLNDFSQKNGLFIEKRGRRIKSKGELEEITFKGLKSLRSKKNKIFGGLKI